MPLDTINCEEFDRRLEQSTIRMRQQRLTLETRAAELEDLIGRYSSVLERLEAETEQGGDPSVKQQNESRDVLKELAERTSAVAAAL
jgi:BMFP domain-containing protein YqiC